MEDDNGLELSLGLSCGASSAKAKGKISSSSDTRTEEGDRGVKIVDNFKNFLQAGNEKQDPGVGSQRSDPIKPSENFFNDLSKGNGEVEATVNLNGRGLWGTNSKRSAEIDEDKRSETGIDVLACLVSLLFFTSVLSPHPPPLHPVLFLFLFPSQYLILSDTCSFLFVVLNSLSKNLLFCSEENACTCDMLF